MPLQRAGYSNIKQSLTLKKKNFELSKKCSNFNIFDDFAYRSVMHVLGRNQPKLAVWRNSLTHTLPKIAK